MCERAKCQRRKKIPQILPGTCGGIGGVWFETDLTSILWRVETLTTVQMLNVTEKLPPSVCAGEKKLREDKLKRLPG